MISQYFDDAERYDLNKALAFKELANDQILSWPIQEGTSLSRIELPDELVDTARRWMISIGVESNDAANFATRISGVYPRALHEEWVTNPDFYSQLLEVHDSPFSTVASFERDWERYRARLISDKFEQVFDETFGLSEIYVPLAAHWKDSKGPVQGRQGGLEFVTSSPRRVCNLHSEIAEFVESSSNLDSIAIAGGPGSGKSSFMKMAAAQMADVGRSVLFVPLHLIDLQANFSKSLDDFFQESGHFPKESPLEAGRHDSPLIILLDGLDELQMQGLASQEAARDFVTDALRWMDRINAQGTRVKLVFAGRDLAVEAASGSLRSESRVYHLLPYFIPSENRGDYDDPGNLLAEDRRDRWWSQYSKLTGRDLVTMPAVLGAGELGEVTAQPLLNYLVALSYFRGKIDVSNISINDIYADLLAAVHERVWEDSKHPSIKDLDFDVFVRLLEEVSIAVWHGAGRTATLAEVEQHCRSSKTTSYLGDLESGLTSGVANLLISFYFRQKGRREDGEKTFEFTHKSFAEYLISRALVRTATQIVDKVGAGLRDPDDGWEFDEALFRWLKLSGKTGLDRDVLAFVRREVSAHPPEDLDRGQVILTRCFNRVLAGSWPLDRLERLGFAEKRRWERNAEEALFAVLNAYARARKNITQVEWPNTASAGAFIRRLQGQRVGPANVVVMNCLSYTNFSNCCFDMMDFYDADLTSADLSGAELNYTNFTIANIADCNFVGATFYYTNVDHVRAKGAYFNSSLTRRAESVIGVFDLGQVKKRDYVESTIGYLVGRGATVEAPNDFDPDEVMRDDIEIEDGQSEGESEDT